jgi:hypothetical protein
MVNVCSEHASLARRVSAVPKNISPVVGSCYTSPQSTVGGVARLVKRFTTALGGRIGCESTLGSGSIFWVRLPLEVIAEPPFEVSFDNDQLGTKPQKILVVEDNAINRQVARCKTRSNIGPQKRLLDAVVEE